MKKVFIIAPSYYTSMNSVKEELEFLRKYFEVHYRKDIFSKWYGFAGNDKRRIDELNEAILSNAEIIWALRGGYGASRILNRINFNTKKKKIFIGFSDFTLIGHSAAQFGHKFIYGPMIKTLFYQRSGTKTVLDILNEPHKRIYNVKGFKKNITGVAKVFCLKLLINLLGTPYEPEFNKNDILFLEDVDEKAYAVDRDIMQLKNGGFLNNIKGIFINLTNIKEKNKLPLIESIEDVLGKRVSFSVKFGHSKKFIPIIYNEKVEIKDEKIVFFDNSII
ncbi:LD-carboxypeptidase [bacterium]|nr:LD-carboxypeptidase [bacterium]